MLLSVSVPALAMPRGSGLPVVKNESVQLIKHRRIRRNRHHRRYNRRGHRHRNNGAAAVVGIITLGTVLAIANSNRRHAYYDDRHYGYQSGSQDWKAACASKYRSFEWHTGLYTTYSGYKRPCRLP